MCMICVDIVKGKMTSQEAVRAIGEEPRVMEFRGDPSHLIKHFQEREALIAELEAKEGSKMKEPGYLRRTFG